MDVMTIATAQSCVLGIALLWLILFELCKLGVCVR